MPKNVLFPAPASFKDVSRDMKTPYFWISKLNEPDKIILTSEEITALNERNINRLGLSDENKRCVTDISNCQKDIQQSSFWVFKLNEPDKIIFASKEITALNKRNINRLGLSYGIKQHSTNIFDVFNCQKDDIQESSVREYYSSLVKMYAKYYGTSLKRVGRKYIKSIIDNIDYSSLDCDIQFAMTIECAQLMVLPVESPLYSTLATIDLDRLKSTQLEYASPVAVLYTTKDRQWYYVISKIAKGWIKASSIVFGSKESIERYSNRTDVVVVTSKQTELYSDPSLKSLCNVIRMGSAIPVSNKKGEVVEVEVPFADKNNELGFKKVYVRTSDISFGFLPYTQRNVIIQAFKYLDMPYGWGDDNDYPDCSSFIRQIFLCFGIILPRNSYAQSRFGESMVTVKFNREETYEQRVEKVLEESVPCITIMYFPGHVVLYIGDNNGNLYAIHSLHEYKHHGKMRLLNRVVVTNMSIGKKTKRRSYLERLTLMKIIK